MHAKHPEIAARWDKEYGGKVAGYSKPAAKKAAAKPIRKGEPSPTGSSMKGRFKTGKAPASYKKAVAAKGVIRKKGAK